MLAPKQISTEYLQWNENNGAPFGFPIPWAKKFKRWLPKSVYWRWRGPFSIQTNNSTRAFEYPFTYSQLVKEQPEKILDIGGGLSGFQFILSRLGYQVIRLSILTLEWTPRVKDGPVPISPWTS